MAAEKIETRSHLRPMQIVRNTGLSKSTVMSALYDGRLQGVRVGRAWLVPVEEVNRWLGVDHATDPKTAEPVSIQTAKEKRAVKEQRIPPEFVGVEVSRLHELTFEIDMLIEELSYIKGEVESFLPRANPDHQK